MPKIIAFKNLGVGLISMFVVCLLCVVSMAVFFPQSTISPTNDGDSSSSASTSSANTQILIERNFQYAGITDKRMLELLGTEDTDNTELELQSTIDLDDQEWRDIMWSPSQDYVAIIGKISDNANFDLLLYNPTTASWRTLTNFANAEAGIDSYLWETGSTIVFTQGVGANKWMHRYDLQNTELRKIFQVSGELVDYHDGRYITKESLGDDNSLFRIYQEQVEQDASNFVAEISTDVLESFSSIHSARLGYGSSEVYVTATDSSGTRLTYAYDLGTTELVPVNQTGQYEFLCRNNTTPAYMLLGTDVNKGIVVESFNPATEESKQIFSRLSNNNNSVDIAAAECRDEGVLLKLVEERTPGSSVYSWIRVSAQDFEDIVEAFNYPDLSYRGLVVE